MSDESRWGDFREFISNERTNGSDLLGYHFVRLTSQNLDFNSSVALSSGIVRHNVLVCHGRERPEYDSASIGFMKIAGHTGPNCDGCDWNASDKKNEM